MLWIKPSDPNKLKLLIAFSGAYLLSITALHLLPEVFTGDDRGAYFGSFVLVGFFIQVMLEYLSGGIEHGHAHTHRSAGLPVGLMIGLCLHAFLEGVAFSPGSDALRGPFVAAVTLHRIPVGLVIWWLISPRHGHPSAAAAVASIPIATALGYAAGIEFLGEWQGQGVELYQAFVAGSLIHVVFHQGRHDHRH